MATFYLQEDGSTDHFSLDIIADLQVGLPGSEYKLQNTLSEGGFITGVGVKAGREISCSYQFVNNKDYERELFLDWFSKPVNSKLYLYKDVTRRFKCNITSGSTIVLMTGSTADIASLSTGKSISGIGIASSAIIDGIGTSAVYIDPAATASITNHQLLADVFNGRLRVYAFPAGGEAYDNINISNSVSFSLLSPNPYFTSTSLITSSLTSTGYDEFSTSVVIKGRRIPAIYTFTSSTDANSVTMFQVKAAEGYGFRVDRQINAGDVVEVDTGNSDLVMTYNGNQELGRFDPASTPFTLEGGVNDLIMVAGPGTIDVKYYERRL